MLLLPAEIISDRPKQEPLIGSAQVTCQHTGSQRVGEEGRRGGQRGGTAFTPGVSSASLPTPTSAISPDRSPDVKQPKTDKSSLTLQEGKAAEK